jgi:hypothetical protein
MRIKIVCEIEVDTRTCVRCGKVEGCYPNQISRNGEAWEVEPYCVGEPIGWQNVGGFLLCKGCVETFRRFVDGKKVAAA